MEEKNIQLASSTSINYCIDRLINLVFKLLPMKEEGLDIYDSIQCIIYDLKGLDLTLNGRYQNKIFLLVTKLNILSRISEHDIFKKNVFYIINKLECMKEGVKDA